MTLGKDSKILFPQDGPGLVPWRARNGPRRRRAGEALDRRARGGCRGPSSARRNACRRRWRIGRTEGDAQRRELLQR